MTMRLVIDDEEAQIKSVNASTPDEVPADAPAKEETSRPISQRKRAIVHAEVEADGSHVDGPVSDAAAGESAEDEHDQSHGVDIGVLEALLFSTHHPLTAPRLAELMELPSAGPLRKAIKQLNASYEEGHRSFRIEQVAGGYQMLTLPEYGEHLARLHQKEIDSKLTKAALETLAIIAYKQPILRADIEAIRGVACGETIRSLMEKHLVKIDGRAEIPGRPILYGTTRRFLELFGLNHLKDLPKGEELRPIG